MNRMLRHDADAIVRASIQAVLPDEAIRRALAEFRPGPGRTLLVAAGKAAWQMANAAVQALGTVDGDTAAALKDAGLDVFAVLKQNDAYHALQAVDGPLVTGPTGTNVNDVAVALLRG